MIWASEADQQSIKHLTIPAELQRSGLVMKLVVNTPNEPSGKPDLKLIRLADRAHQLAMQFISGKVQTIQEMADAEGAPPATSPDCFRLGFWLQTSCRPSPKANSLCP